jgi:putative flavoprotein involved in K+ transport
MKGARGPCVFALRSIHSGRVEPCETVVIGAGAAGLAAAAMLRTRGVETLVLERAPKVADAWRRRYDRLRLNTLRRFSDMPGYRFDRRYGNYPSRDDMVAYLERYAEHYELNIRFNTNVLRVDRAAGAWIVDAEGASLEAERVVLASGYDSAAYVPDWPGAADFTGTLSHAATYRNAVPYRDRDVLVVGAGNTASDVATDLAEGGARRVRIAVRTPPNIFPRDCFGMPTQYATIIGEKLPRLFDRIGFLTQRSLYGDLAPYGLPRPAEGLQTHFRNTCHGPMVDEGFIDAVKAGAIEVVAAVERFESSDVLLVDGNRVRPEVVLAATGYRRGLEPLVGHLGVLRPDGRPLVHGGATHPNAPNLHFIGFVRKISGQLRPMRRDAKRIARVAACGGVAEGSHHSSGARRAGADAVARPVSGTIR